MTAHDERMWKLLTSSPTTSCEKWAATRIKDLEAQLSQAETRGIEITVRFLDAHGFTDAAVRVQAMLDGAFI